MLGFSSGIWAQVTPQANFSHSVNRLTPLRISFTDLSTPTGEITSWTWDFGDGTAFSTVQNPDHLYGSAGEYQVKLTVKRGTVQNTKIKTISATQTLNPIFAKSASSGKPPLSVTLDARASTGFITEQLWVISPSSGVTYTSGNAGTETATVKFATAGTYNISLRVSDGAQVKESAKQTVTVKNAPKVDFAWPTPVYLGQEVQFTDLTEFPCPSGISYVWTFPFPGSSTLPNPKYTFYTLGTWDVKLCVTDACGNNECVMKKVQVLDPESAVFARYTTSKLVIRRGETVDFYDTSTPRDQIKGWFWYFELPPDLANTTGGADLFYTTYEDHEKVSHTFNTPGLYKVRLQVTYDLEKFGHFQDVLIRVYDAPELNPAYSIPSSSAQDYTLSEDHYAIMTMQTINVLKKNGSGESAEWQPMETYYNSVGWPNDMNVSFHDIKLKNDVLMIMKSAYGGGSYSYRVIPGIGTRTGVQSSIGGGDIPTHVFGASIGKPKFDINDTEAAIVAVEADGTYLYHIRSGTYDHDPLKRCWSCTSGNNPVVVTKKKLKDAAASLGNIYLDDQAVVALVGGEIFIYEKNNGNWDFSTQKKIAGSFKSVAYFGNVIMTTPTSCGPSNSALVEIRERQSSGWSNNQPVTASLFADDQEIIPGVTSICSPDENSLAVAGNVAVVKVRLYTNGTELYRQFVYRKWADSWVNSKQTYKIDHASTISRPIETSDVDCIYRSGNDVSGTVNIANFLNYCMLGPYVMPSFTLNTAQFDVVNGIIELGGGETPAIFNSGARAKYLGREITLKPGVQVKSGAKVSFRAVNTCDELYYN
jgi:PKD repeat protein